MLHPGTHGSALRAILAIVLLACGPGVATARESVDGPSRLAVRQDRSAGTAAASTRAAGRRPQEARKQESRGQDPKGQKPKGQDPKGQKPKEQDPKGEPKGAGGKGQKPGDAKPHQHSFTEVTRKEWVEPVTEKVQTGTDAKGRPIYEQIVVKPGYFRKVKEQRCPCGAVKR